MATLAQMKTRIAEELQRSDLSARIASVITDAIEEYQGRRFAFNQARATFSTVASQEYYDTTIIPTDIAQIDSMRVTANGRTTPVVESPFSLLERLSDGTSTRGEPSRWCWYGQQIRLYPIPDAIYTVSIAYLQRIDAPADNASNAWTNEANELIRACVCAKLCRKDLRDPEGAREYEYAELRAVRKLLRESTQLQGGPLVGSM